MLTPTSNLRHYNVRKGETYIKPEQETAISNFTLGKAKITDSRCFLNRCEESDNLGSQGSLLQMKPGCSAIHQLTHAQQTLVNKWTDTSWRQNFFAIKCNGNDVTSKWIVDIPKIRVTPDQIPRSSFPGSDPRWSGNETSHASDEATLPSHPTHSAYTEPIHQEVTS